MLIFLLALSTSYPDFYSAGNGCKPATKDTHVMGQKVFFDKTGADLRFDLQSFEDVEAAAEGEEVELELESDMPIQLLVLSSTGTFVESTDRNCPNMFVKMSAGKLSYPVWKAGPTGEDVVFTIMFATGYSQVTQM